MRFKKIPGSLANKRILLRLDLNVPLRSGRISDDYKIRQALPSIKHFRRCPLVILSHLGEPEPAGDYQFFPALSLGPIARRLADLLGRPVTLVSGSWAEIGACAAALKAGDIMLVENLRFWAGETANDRRFARQLAALGDIYVNDAFAVSHRRHASVSAIKNCLPSYAGPGLAAECSQLAAVRDSRGRLVVVMGGAKISTKLPLIKKFLPAAQCLLIGGGLANGLLSVRGTAIGRSFFDASAVGLPGLARSPKIVLPTDAVLLKGKSKRWRIAPVSGIAPDEAIVDIGPATGRAYAAVIAKADRIIWNGPMGVFEKPFARGGTQAIIRALIAAHRRGALVTAGGGETAAAIAGFHRSGPFAWETTGGGASLAFLAGQPMPGLDKL